MTAVRSTASSFRCCTPRASPRSSWARTVRCSATRPRRAALAPAMTRSSRASPERPSTSRACRRAAAALPPMVAIRAVRSRMTDFAALRDKSGSTQELPRVLGELRTALRPRGVLFASNPRGDGSEGWNRGRYAAYHDLEAWRRFMSVAGFVELTHYYRPAGLPRDQQPWLASVWRK